MHGCEAPVAPVAPCYTVSGTGVRRSCSETRLARACSATLPRRRAPPPRSAQESTLKGRRPKTKVVIFVANCRAAKHLEPELGNGYMDKSKTPCGVNTNLIWRCALRP